MQGAERTIQSDRIWPSGGSVAAFERAAAQRSWVERADWRTLETEQPPRLWRGVGVALLLVAPFWCLVALALDWAIGG